jgi:hypothetical protein
MDLKKIGYEFVCWVHLVQDMDWWSAAVNMAKNLLVPLKAGYFLTS